MSRIVVIEDDGALRRDLVDQLKDWGHKVAEAGETRTGEELVETLRPDILLCDVQLPCENGFQLAQRVRQRHENIVIIFISALGETEELLLGEVCGGDAYIVKPIDYELLAEKIEFYQVHRGGVITRFGKWMTGAARF